MSRVFALSDLHLGFAVNKPMDVFGSIWANHSAKIERLWRKTVAPEDIVLVPGDISWGINYREAEPDLKFLDSLPGTKYICRGNHDYWWKSLKQTDEFTGDSIVPLQRTAVNCGEFVLAASRGWSTPLWEGYSITQDAKIYTRELGRMQLTLSKAKEVRQNLQKLVYMMHYPPVVDGKPSEFAELLAEAGVSLCIYGHLHGSWSDRVDMSYRGVEFLLTSADYLNFDPLNITDRIC
ncbi:serine/threonine protein phosphatase [Candidatus Fermentibacteria bacterium]|nr:MAG: serine/threonine protein phosphatase [Candidatus Fermentibacteria bacterium]